MNNHSLGLLGGTFFTTFFEYKKIENCSIKSISIPNVFVLNDKIIFVILLYLIMKKIISYSSLN